MYACMLRVCVQYVYIIVTDKYRYAGAVITLPISMKVEYRSLVNTKSLNIEKAGRLRLRELNVLTIRGSETI
jgi:hypothetical protein